MSEWIGDALLGATLLLIALVLWRWSGRQREESGLPDGDVMRSDVDSKARGKPLYSARYGLTGTPDYIVETSRGLVPLEVKPARNEAEPHESHLLQVLAYCLLLEESEGACPPYGLLRYANDTFKVDYNKETRECIIGVIHEMRNTAAQSEVHRSHQSAGRCRACAYRSICDEALWADR